MLDSSTGFELALEPGPLPGLELELVAVGGGLELESEHLLGPGLELELEHSGLLKLELGLGLGLLPELGLGHPPPLSSVGLSRGRLL